MAVPPGYVAFDTWISGVLSESASTQILGFVLNLYESEDGCQFQLCGSTGFDREDEEWAQSCEFTSGENVLELSSSIVGQAWEVQLESAIALMRAYLHGGQHADRLRSANGIAVGFVDGDLDVIWTSADA